MQERFVVCINNEGYEASLVLHKIYRVLPDAEAVAEGDVRVTDESGEDYLYRADRFAAIEIPAPLRKLILQAA
jgi:hypothetical protein